MTGVEILNQIEVTDTQIGIGYGWVLFAGVAFFMLFFALSGFDEFGVIAGAIVGIGVALIMIFTSVEEIPTGEYRYEVIVEDTVNLQEFYNYYNVVEQRGEIFIVEEKTTE